MTAISTSPDVFHAEAERRYRSCDRPTQTSQKRAFVSGAQYALSMLGIAAAHEEGALQALPEGALVRADGEVYRRQGDGSWFCLDETSDGYRVPYASHEVLWMQVVDDQPTAYIIWRGEA